MSPIVGTIRAMFEDIILAYGGFDDVVITAGVFVPPDRGGHIPDNMWALTFSVNVIGAYQLPMKLQNSGENRG